MNDNTQFANQFIDLWQGNIEKMLSGDENMRQMQQMFDSMKGFYAPNNAKQSTAAADSDAHSNGDDARLIRSLERRVVELEARIANLEKPSK